MFQTTQSQSRSKWVRVWVTVFGVLSAVLPDPTHLLVGCQIVMPWVVVLLVAHYQPAFRLAGRADDTSLDLSVAFLFPGIFLSMRAAEELNTLETTRLVLLLSCAGALILLCAGLKAEPRLRQKYLLALMYGVMACGYGYGAGLEINMLADSTAPQVFPTKVLGKHVNDSGDARIRYLQVEPWGPVQSIQYIRVTGTLYRK